MKVKMNLVDIKIVIQLCLIIVECCQVLLAVPELCFGVQFNT